MKKYIFVLWLLMTMMPSVAFTADVAQPGKESNTTVSNNSDKEIKTHKKIAKKSWSKAKAKTTKMEEKDKSK